MFIAVPLTIVNEKISGENSCYFKTQTIQDINLLQFYLPPAETIKLFIQHSEKL